MTTEEYRRQLQPLTEVHHTVSGVLAVLSSDAAHRTAHFSPRVVDIHTGDRFTPTTISYLPAPFFPPYPGAPEGPALRLLNDYQGKADPAVTVILPIEQAPELLPPDVLAALNTAVQRSPSPAVQDTLAPVLDLDSYREQRGATRPRRSFT